MCLNKIALVKKQSSVTVNDAVIFREHEGVLVVIRLAALSDDGKRLNVSPREKVLTSFMFMRKSILVPKCTDFSIQNA
jgi:hypothetical protein